MLIAFDCITQLADFKRVISSLQVVIPLDSAFARRKKVDTSDADCMSTFEESY